MMNYAEFGKLLRKTRKVNRLSLDDVSGIIGITPKSLGKIERGKCKPKLDTVMKLFDLYGMSGAELDRFYTRDEEMQAQIDACRKKKKR